jgi:hypothetical protein
MMPQTSEASAKAGPGVLLGGEPGNLSEFAIQAQLLSARLRLPLHLARCVLALLRSDVW